MRGYASGTCRFRQEEPFCVRGGVLKWKSSCSSWEDPESGTALNLKWQLPTKERAGTSPQLFRKHFLSWPERLAPLFFLAVFSAGFFAAFFLAFAFAFFFGTVFFFAVFL